MWHELSTGADMRGMTQNPDLPLDGEIVASTWGVICLSMVKICLSMVKKGPFFASRW
jgi:hypothetical protein